jgi:outer membrane protein assembly factor BamB
VPRKSETTTEATTTGTAEPEFTLPPAPTSTAPDDPVPLAIGSEWPRHQHDARNTGHIKGTTAVPTDTSLYWQFYVHSSPPVVAAGTLFAVETTRDGRRIVARSSATGEVRWERPLDGGPAATPAVAGKRVLVQSRRRLFAFDRDGGDRLWTTAVGRGVPSAPAVVDGVAYCCSAARGSWPTTVFAVDAATGDRRWAAELDGGVPGGVAVGGGTVYVATDAGRLHALGTIGGGGRWSVELASPATGTPLVSREMLFVPTGAGLESYWTDDGRTRWRAEVGRITGDAPAFAGDSVYVGTEHGVHALKWATGTELWRYDTGAPATTPTVDREAVYAGERSGERPAVFAVGRDDGKRRWSRRTGAPDGTDREPGVRGPPTPVAGGLYAAAGDGMYAFGPDRGPRGAATPDANATTTTTVAGDGTAENA